MSPPPAAAAAAMAAELTLAVEMDSEVEGRARLSAREMDIPLDASTSPRPVAVDGAVRV